MVMGCCGVHSHCRPASEHANYALMQHREKNSACMHVAVGLEANSRVSVLGLWDLAYKRTSASFSRSPPHTSLFNPLPLPLYRLFSHTMSYDVRVLSTRLSSDSLTPTAKALMYLAPGDSCREEGSALCTFNRDIRKR